MMKLHRPLCSDVTLRLTADLSPDEDDVDDVMTSINKLNEGNSCSCCLDNSVDNGEPKTCHHRIYRRQFSDQNDNHYATNRHTNYKRNRTNSLNHNHNCSWYSRQNTDDKTAKDIYNQEHLLHNGVNFTSDFKKVTLDSEFKRSFEEDGNDFKETSILQELTQNGFPENQRRGVELNRRQRVLSKLNTMYSDAKLSCSKDTARLSRTDKLIGDDDDNDDENEDEDEIGECNGLVDNGFCLKRRRHASGDTDVTNTTFDDDDEDMTKKETDEDLDDDEDVHPGMDTDFSDEFDDDIPPSRLSELPVDMDEDVDVVDKQLMSDSMIESFYGEVDESLLQTSMTKSIHDMDAIPDEMSKSIAEEIHDVILGDDSTKDGCSSSSGSDDRLKNQLPFPYPFTLKHAGHLFDKCGQNFARTAASAKPKSRERTISSTSRSTVGERARTTSSTSTTTPTSDTSFTAIDTPPHGSRGGSPSNYSSYSSKDASTSSTRVQTLPDNTESKREVTHDSSRQKCSVATMTVVQSLDLEVTHRGLHRFVPRHKDEINIGIGDPIHVLKECDDLWCEGINLRTGEKGIFPAVYANDLTFLEESDDDEEYWKFSMRFLGSVEVTSHKGDETLVQAINKVAMSHKGNVRAAACSSLEISQYGIRMIDKSKEGHEKDAFSHFFALKNISFCGTHPKNNRYFAFITKHPRQYRFACHVFYGDRPTHRARDALGEAFKRFYQEYMAFTHPTEDIYME